jgi:hypothetical protein
VTRGTTLNTKYIMDALVKFLKFSSRRGQWWWLGTGDFIEITLPCTPPLWWLNGRHPGRSRWSSNRLIDWILPRPTSSCFPRWRGSWPASPSFNETFKMERAIETLSAANFATAFRQWYEHWKIVCWHQWILC